MNEVHVSPKALEDLTEIKTYITDELENPQAAVSTVAKMIKTIRLLREHAQLGAPLSSVADIDSDYRYLISGSYMIFYRTADRNVFIDRILYARRDYLHILFDDLNFDE